MDRIGSVLSVMDRWSIRARLIFSFMVLIALSVALGGTSIWMLGKVKQSSDDLANKWLPSIHHLANARLALLSYREFQGKHARAEDASYLDEYEEKINKAAAEVNKQLSAYDEQEVLPDERPLLDTLLADWKKMHEQGKKIINLARNNERADAQDISDGLGKDLFDTTLKSLDGVFNFAFTASSASNVQAKQTFELARQVVVGILLGTLVIGLSLAALVTRGLLKQLGGEATQAVMLVKAVADGNLTTPIALHPSDSTSLMANLKAMQANLNQVVSSVRQASDQVAEASEQIAGDNTDLSQRTEVQASALQQTAASMDELGTTVQQNAANARMANDLALQASQVAQTGGQVVNEVIDAMKVINESSRRIADIIGVIDGIAFQTNILALNAAVEAARAGEQGRGFAVVASEVRSLAQRSATAAKEISGLISASNEQVQVGAARVDKAGATMQEVVQAIGRVTQIVNEISAASEQQTQGVQEVGQAVNQMDQSTQQNAALVEKSAQATESLRQQSKQLVDAVAVFKTV